MTSMLDCIYEQPACYRSILENENYHFAAFDRLVKGLPLRRILVLATGSSWNALMCASSYIETVSGVEMQVTEPYSFVHYPPTGHRFDLIVAVSQRGTSSSTISAVQAAKEAGAVPVVVLTAHLDAPICRFADAVVDIGCGPETIAFSTKGVSATILTAMLLGLHLGQECQVTPPPGLTRTDLMRITAQSKRVITTSEAFYRAYASHFDSATRVYVTGYGPNFGTAHEAETKILETVRIPCAGEELESYMHGPVFETHRDYTIFLIDVPASTCASRSTRLAQFLRRYCDHVHPVSLGSASDSHTLALDCDPVHELCSPLLLVLCFQVIACHMSAARSIDLSVPVFPDFKEFMGTKVVSKAQSSL